jgi:hypothetical protein
MVEVRQRQGGLSRTVSGMPMPAPVVGRIRWDTRSVIEGDLRMRIDDGWLSLFAA